MTSRITTTHWYPSEAVELNITEGSSVFNTKLHLISVVELVESANQNVPWLLNDIIVKTVKKNAEAYFDRHEEISDHELSEFLRMLEEVME